MIAKWTAANMVLLVGKAMGGYCGQSGQPFEIENAM